MLKVGLIGAGFMGSTHSRVYQIIANQMDIKLHAVADIRQEYGERAARMHQAKYYQTADELLNDDEIDIIDICLPTYLHASVAKRAMEKGKNVFIEKPVVLRPEDGDMLLDLQRKTGAKVMVGQCIRLWPAYQYLKKVYDSKQFGKLKNLVLNRVSTFPTWGFENWYADFAKSGGAVLDLHIHDIDYMRYLLGEPQIVSISGNRDHVFGIYEYEHNTIVEIESGWDFPAVFPASMEYRAQFDEAAVTYRNGEVTVYTNTGRQFQANVDSELEDDDDLSDLGGYYHELKYFYDCLLSGKEIEIAPLTEGVKSVKLIYKEIELGGF